MSSTARRSSRPLLAYRIGSAAHPLLDGSGAARSQSARWNTQGRYVIYAAEHYATAVLEKAAQLNSITLPRTLVFTAITIAANATSEEVRPGELEGWDRDDRLASQAYGDRWYDEQRSLVLFVPSLAAPGIERNVLINQRHPLFARGVRATDPEPLRCHPALLD
jgi:RES domain-containing protein